MPTYKIPGRGSLSLSTLVLDLNGTVAIGGEIIPGIGARVKQLQARGMTCHLLTADTRGRGAATAATLGLALHRLRPGDEARQKEAFVREQGAGSTVAIGNGANDAGMLAAAALGIAVLQAEGTAIAALQAADVAVPDINAALDLLLYAQRLIATLRA
jgi:P-type E1-E2 ATPase